MIKNNHQNKLIIKYIPKEMLRIIKDLQERYPELIFGGSLSLLFFNVIKRKLGDIDIIIDIDNNRKLYKEIEKEFKSDEEYYTPSESANLFKNRNGIKINVLDSNNFFVKLNINNFNLNLAAPEYAIKAKKEYTQNLNKNQIKRKSSLRKHYNDINKYLKSDYYRFIKKYEQMPIRTDFLSQKFLNRCKIYF